MKKDFNKTQWTEEAINFCKPFENDKWKLNTKKYFEYDYKRSDVMPIHSIKNKILELIRILISPERLLEEINKKINKKMYQKLYIKKTWECVLAEKQKYYQKPNWKIKKKPNWTVALYKTKGWNFISSRDSVIEWGDMYPIKFVHNNKLLEIDRRDSVTNHLSFAEKILIEEAYKKKDLEILLKFSKICDINYGKYWWYCDVVWYWWTIGWGC